MSVAFKTKLSNVPAAPPPWPMHRFTVKQYHRMIETGILNENDRVELLEGWIVPKMTHNPPHDAAVDLAQTTIALLPQDWRVRVQSAITIGDSEPEPDVAVVRGPARRYAKRHPRVRDIGMLTEVADTTLLEDRSLKQRVYAGARIPVSWQPKGGKSPGYRQRRDYGKDESVPLVIGGRRLGQIPVRDLLP